LGRPFGKHIDNQELNALVPSCSETGRESPDLSPDVVREAQLHVRSCLDCGKKVWKYWLLANRLSIVTSEVAPAGRDCPKDDDVNWFELAAGLWPELKAAQLIQHAALCAHCGPLLRAATRLEHYPTPSEQKMVAGLTVRERHRAPASSSRGLPIWFSTKWFAAAMTLILLAGAWAARSSLSSRPLSGSEIAEFALATHRQHAQGMLPLDLRTDSQWALNQWFKEKLQFELALPASAPVPGEQRPYSLEGARLVPVGGKTAAFIAYRMSGLETRMASTSLLVTPDSVAVAEGGVKANFAKVSFHYSRLDGYKVVTWSLHGLTYALVAQEDDTTQRSCMVCHSAMGDRDLSNTSTPLRPRREAAEPVWQ
jgi:anti-sigma factor RsiW